MSDQFYQSSTVQCPYPNYAELRANSPAHQLEGEDVFLVTRHADCEDVLARPEVFSSKAGPGLRQRDLMVAAKVHNDSEYRVVRTLLTNDPPSHTRFRKLVAKAFTARRISGLNPKIKVIVGELVDSLPESGEVDLVARLAQPLPLIVIADFLGVPRSDLPAFQRWSDDAAEVLGGMLTAERSLEVDESLQELLGYFDKLVSERRLQPSNDFLSLMIEARSDEDGPLQTNEILAIAYVTLVAGNETTVNLVSSLLLLLLQQQHLWPRLQADRKLILTAVEEALRLEAPVQGSVRVASQDTSIAGTAIAKGSRVLIVSGAANRDETVFAEPDTFDVDRKNSRAHLSFGKGIHFCLGAALSRLEAQVALEILLDRVEDIALPAGFVPEYADNAVLRSLLSLPVTFSKATP